MRDNELLLAMSNMLDTKLEEKLEEKLQPIKEEIHVLKEDVGVLKDEVHIMKGRICVLQEDVQHVKLYQENILEPRLNTIEACYTSTYGRCQNDVDRMEKAFDDIDMLKQTVARHSEQLRKMA